MMHEYSLVGALLDRAESEARKHGKARVKRVSVAVGALAGVEVELLVRAWETFREKTICDGAPLVVRDVPAEWTCPRCHQALRPGAALSCSECGVPAQLSAGGDLILERLELEVGDV